MKFSAAVFICAAILPCTGNNFDEIENSVLEIFHNVVRLVGPSNHTKPEVMRQLEGGAQAIMTYVQMLFVELNQTESDPLVLFTSTFFRKFSDLFKKIATTSITRAEANRTLGNELAEFRVAIGTLDGEIREAGREWADYLESMFFGVVNFFTYPDSEATKRGTAVPQPSDRTHKRN